MVVRRERRSSLRGTYHATKGLIGGARGGADDTLFPTGADCEGFGAELGDTGGFGEEADGFGAPCLLEGWHIAAVLEEAIAFSRISGVDPSAFGTGLLREDGGELVILGSVGAISAGPYEIFLRPVGTSVNLICYSGVLGQGNVIEPDLVRNRLAFVSPLTTQLGPVDIILKRPGGDILVSDLLTYVAYSDRSGSRFLRSLFPGNWAAGTYDPTVT